MISPAAEVEIREVALADIRLEQSENRSLVRVAHYLSLLEEEPDAHLGLLIVAPCAHGMYELQDGHHRFIAYLIAGRPRALAAVVSEPGPAAGPASPAS
jgi:hypothetical protein